MLIDYLTRVLNSFLDLGTPNFESLVVFRLADFFFLLFLAPWLQTPFPTFLPIVVLVDSSLFLFPTEHQVSSTSQNPYKDETEKCKFLEGMVESYAGPP